MGHVPVIRSAGSNWSRPEQKGARGHGNSPITHRKLLPTSSLPPAPAECSRSVHIGTHRGFIDPSQLPSASNGDAQ